MISIQSAMLVALGFFAAALIGFLLAPFYRRRAQRLATGALKATMPLTSQEIAADKDRLRAQFALTIHRLERKMEEATHAAAKQMVEINRRDAGISALEGEVQRLRTSLEEHENARRVLEQTITERLPKVEHRLTEAKKLLFQRDREIASLTQSAQRQALALEEATGINAQQRDEIHRLSATLTARAARNRDALSDPRFDGEVALRAEIEALRSKARDQTALINRLQGALVNTTGARSDQVEGGSGASPQNGYANANGVEHETEINRLRKDLADAEFALKSARGMAEAGHAGQAALEAEIRSLKASNEDHTAEVMKLRAALRAYEAEDADKAVKESKVALRARVSALQAQADEHTGTIQRLRAEMAAANEKLARQAQHYMEEMRRLGAGTLPASGASRGKETSTPAHTLVERISTPRPPRELRAPNKGRQAEDPLRVSGFLRALDGAANAEAQAPSGSSEAAESGEAAGVDAAQEGARAGRRPGLLERITRVEKPA